MWKNQVYQCCGWALVGGGACVAGYLAYKHDLFGQGFLAGKDNLTTTDDMEVKLPKPSEQVPEQQEQKQTNESASIPIEDSLAPSNVTNSGPNVVADQSIVTIQPISTTENQQFLYKFTATNSSADSDQLDNSQFALEVCVNDWNDCEEKIEELRIYASFSADFSTKTLLRKKTNFVNENVYLFETKKEIENDWLNKQLRITFSSEEATRIKNNSLEKIT